nr:FimV/HubP family polar landmark protein [Aliivibrio sp. SR45-2]
MFVASQCSVANAASTIQIVGPDGKDQTISSQVVAPASPTRTSTVKASSSAVSAPTATKIYGPTGENETLWSIASRVNPSTTTSVQQTLLAIYRLNPQAFENNNIHGLEPKSRLRLPTLEQVRRENTDDAKQLLAAHKKKQTAQKKADTRSSVAPKASTEPKVDVKPKLEKPTFTEKKTAVEKTVAPVMAEKTTGLGELKTELATTEQEFSALQENNHQLRVRLAEVQNEVDNLKNELGNEDRIRNEVEKFITEQKQLAVSEKKAEPSSMDKLASSPGLIALLALIPGALIAGLIAFFLSRRKKEEEEEAEENTQTDLPSALIMPDDHFNMDDDIPEISLDDDDDILGDLDNDEFLFGDDTNTDSNDDLFAEFENENTDSLDDPFASLDDEDDLDSLLSKGDSELSDLDDLDSLDDLDDDLDMSGSALTVDAEEKALGLEEMEKALNDFDSDLFSESDLEAEDDDFDLSLIDDSDLSALDKKSPELEDNEDLEGGELDQSMLDDLFSSMDTEEDEESVLDQGWDLDEKEETKIVSEPEKSGLEEDVDFESLLGDMANTEDDSIDFNLDDDTEVLNNILPEQNEKSDTSLELEDDSTALLDKMLAESDDDDINLDIDDDNTSLLDEMLAESNDDDDDLELDDNSTALLDELLEESDHDSTDLDDIEIDEDSTALLDELLADDEDDSTFELDENSTALLDELIGDDSDEEEALGKSGDDAEEGVTVSETLSEETPRDEDWLVESDDEEDDISLFEPETALETEAFDIDEELPLESEMPTDNELEDDVIETLNTDTEERNDVELAEEIGSASQENDELDAFDIDDEELPLESEMPTDNELEDDVIETLNTDTEEHNDVELAEETESASQENDELDAFDIDEEELSLESEMPTDNELEDDVIETLNTDTEEHNDVELAEETGSASQENDELDAFDIDDEELLLESEIPTDSEDLNESTISDLLSEQEEQESLFDEINVDDELLLDNEERPQEQEVSSQLEETETATEEDETLSELDDLLADFDTDVEISDEEAGIETPEIEELVTDEESEIPLSDMISEDENEDESDFSLDDFVASNATDFTDDSREHDTELSEANNEEDILPLVDDIEKEDHQFDGLSIEDALAALEEEDDLQVTPLTDETAAPFNFSSQVSDEEKEALTHVDSAGLDIDSMLEDGGSDWSGFSLDDTSNVDDALEDEDWSEQPNLENTPNRADQFLSIDALIAEAESGERTDIDDEELNLDVGLDEFPDVLGNVEAHDVDINSDAHSKLDLAKAYIEMSDDKGALELLEEVLRCDDPLLKVEAEKLMKQLD